MEVDKNKMMALDALKQVQDEVGKVPKESVNTYYNTKYFDINKLLELCKPILSRYGFIITQPIRNGAVYTELHHESGVLIDSYLELPKENNPQKIGSAITYYRRYTLQSLLALEAEDDDGNLASGAVKPVTQNKEAKDNKPWLNLTTKNGEFTKLYSSILTKHQKEPILLENIKKSFRISKKDEKALNNLGIK